MTSKQDNGKCEGNGWESLYIPTHVVMKPRHGWGTRSFGLVGKGEKAKAKRQTQKADPLRG
jgi:hypothetical protein